ncbi:hypothetical protein HD806DRAFT_528775 [Xylariaceae sp. AK1471]|nr:hypothetical protein HD806DRAFT_528775 [Xylariaceae sp. AK1471]
MKDPPSALPTISAFVGAATFAETEVEGEGEEKICPREFVAVGARSSFPEGGELDPNEISLELKQSDPFNASTSATSAKVISTHCHRKPLVSTESQRLHSSSSSPSP